MEEMPIQIGQKQESDFNNPLGLLSDCHRRIEHFLQVLIRGIELASVRALGSDERSAFEKALVYFRDAAPKHTADEEDSLFPRLRATEDGSATLDRLEELERDHTEAAKDHDTVDRLGRMLLAQGNLPAGQQQDISNALSRLSLMYSRHIAIEDRELFPLAGRLLRAEELAAVGREMAD